MNKLLTFLGVYFLALHGICQFPNIMIGNLYTPEETSIIINPKNPSQVVAGANLDNYYYSQDGGLTWNWGQLVCTYGVWGDPCLISDTAGNFYFIHLSNPPSGGSFIDRVVFQKSQDGGATWSGGTYTGLNGAKDEDKAWAVTDPATNNIYVSWTQFDKYGSSNPLDSSNIMFSKSLDGGLSWSTPIRINKVAGDCIDSDNTVEGAVPAVGPDGEIYDCWAGPLGLVFNRSLDKGNTWMDTNVFVSDMPGGWDYSMAGIYRCNGLPVTCCDLSFGPYRGTVYVNWTDQRNGLEDTDVWLIKSTDGGIHWSQRKRVNDDPPGKQQFFTWMTVDQVTGYLYFIFYDRRAYTDDRTDVYLAVSRDGGETFTNMKLSDSPFVPNSNIFFGDYTGISAYNGIVRPVWTRLDNVELSIWTAIADSIFTGTGEKPESMVSLSLDQNYPNPGKNFTYFSYKAYKPAVISLSVYDIYGREVANVVSNKNVLPGKYIEYLDISRAGLPAGLYYYSLIKGDQVIRKKMIIDY